MYVISEVEVPGLTWRRGALEWIRYDPLGCGMGDASRVVSADRAVVTDFIKVDVCLVVDIKGEGTYTTSPSFDERISCVRAGLVSH